MLGLDLEPRQKKQADFMNQANDTKIQIMWDLSIRFTKIQNINMIQIGWKMNFMNKKKKDLI